MQRLVAGLPQAMLRSAWQTLSRRTGRKSGGVRNSFSMLGTSTQNEQEEKGKKGVSAVSTLILDNTYTTYAMGGACMERWPHILSTHRHTHMTHLTMFPHIWSLLKVTFVDIISCIFEVFLVRGTRFFLLFTPGVL